MTSHGPNAGWASPFPRTGGAPRARHQATPAPRFDGPVLWQSKVGAVAVATFGGLGWSLSHGKAVAFSAATEHRVYSSPSFFDDTQGFPPVVDAGHVYVNTGTKLMCLTLPS